MFTSAPPTPLSSLSEWYLTVQSGVQKPSRKAPFQKHHPFSVGVHACCKAVPNKIQVGGTPHCLL